MKHETIERIETALLAGPQTLGQLSEKLDKSLPSLSLQLEEMRKGGIIERWGRQGSYKIFMLKGSHPRKKFYRFGQAIGANEAFFSHVREKARTNIPQNEFEKILRGAEKAADMQKSAKLALKGKSPNLKKIGDWISNASYTIQAAKGQYAKLAWKYLDKDEIEKPLMFLGSAIMFALEKAHDNSLLFSDFCRGLWAGIGDVFLHESSAFKERGDDLQALWDGTPQTDDFQVLQDKISKLKKKPPKARSDKPQALEGPPENGKVIKERVKLEI